MLKDKFQKIVMWAAIMARQARWAVARAAKPLTIRSTDNKTQENARRVRQVRAGVLVMSGSDALYNSHFLRR